MFKIKKLLSQNYFLQGCLSFSSGLPLALINNTLQVWMIDEHIDLAIVGIFSLANLPYNLKFLWSPLLDRFNSPFLSHIGRRRGWIFMFQLLLTLSLFALASSEPNQSTLFVASLAFVIAFCSASQDIAIDAFRTESLETKDIGIGGTIHNLAFRLATLFSGPLALMLSVSLSWRAVYALMATTLLLLSCINLFAPASTKEPKLEKSFKAAVVKPFLEFFKRKGSPIVLGFILLYKLDGTMEIALLNPFLMHLGFSKSEIAAAGNTFGFAATLLGTFLGAIGFFRLGTWLSLGLFSLLQAISGYLFYLLAIAPNFPHLIGWAVGAECFFSGMGNVAFSAFLMSLCHPKHTMTQYALFSSLMVLGRTLAGGPASWLVNHVGWDNFYLLSIFFSLPGLYLLLRFPDWLHDNDQFEISPVKERKRLLSLK